MAFGKRIELCVHWDHSVICTYIYTTTPPTAFALSTYNFMKNEGESGIRKEMPLSPSFLISS